VSGSKLLELAVNEWNHRVQSLLIAGMNTLQQLRDLHGRPTYYTTVDADAKQFGNALDS
jgi:hypothetical protein